MKRIGMIAALLLLTLFAAPSVADVVTEGSSAEIGRFVFTVILLLLCNVWIFVRPPQFKTASQVDSSSSQ